MQCFARYQRNLSKEVIVSDQFTQVEDDTLVAAVAAYGDRDWERVSMHLPGRLPRKCAEHWLKKFDPSIKSGKWDLEEDRRLRLAMEAFGNNEKISWARVQELVPTRTDAKCRERWTNVLKPGVNLSRFTKDDYKRLDAAMAKYGEQWSQVALAVGGGRTDNQCRRAHVRRHEDDGASDTDAASAAASNGERKPKKLSKAAQKKLDRCALFVVSPFCRGVHRTS